MNDVLYLKLAIAQKAQAEANKYLADSVVLTHRGNTVFTFEPHEIQRLLAQRPDALGLAVPGMPVGSPGMDGPEYIGRKDPYDVLLVTKNLVNSDVSTRVFTSYR